MFSMKAALAEANAHPAWCMAVDERDRLEIRLTWLDEQIAAHAKGTPRRKTLRRRRAVVYDAYCAACDDSQWAPD